MKLLKRRWSGRDLAELTTSVLLILGPFLTFLQYHGYPVFAPEAILVSLLLLVAAVPLFLMLQRGGRWRVAGLFLAMCVFVDLQFDVEKYVSFWFVPPVLAALAWVLREHLSSVLAVAGTGFYVAALVLPTGKNVVRLRVPTQAVSVDTTLPPVFHLVLDELTGIDAWRTVADRANPSLDSLEAVLARHGFLVFRNAYSRYAQTQNALAKIMNDSASSNPMAFLTGRPAPDGEHWPPFTLLQSVYFRTLAARGYVLDIYQSDFLDLCRTNDAPVERCLTYPRNGARHLLGMTLPSGQKAVVLGLYFLHHASHYFKTSRRVYLSALASQSPVGGLRWLEWNGTLLPSLSELLQYVEADANAGVRGRVFLVHAMDPHSPYSREANCRTVPEVGEWLKNDDPLLASGANSEAGRAHRYQRYWMQLACLAKELNQFLAWISVLPGAQDAVLVIHSDHGSRIGQRHLMMRFSGEFSATDVADYYSTLFAIKAPMLRAGVADDVVLVGELLMAAARSRFKAIEVRDIDTLSVFLNDRPTRLGTLLLERRSVAGGRSSLVPAPRRSGR